jgi:hypothetical protein
MTTALADALLAGTVEALCRGHVDGACRLVLDHVLRRQRRPAAYAPETRADRDRASVWWLPG